MTKTETPTPSGLTMGDFLELPDSAKLEIYNLTQQRDQARRERDYFLDSLQLIIDTPCSMVNDAESLRYTIKLLRHIAGKAIDSTKPNPGEAT